MDNKIDVAQLVRDNEELRAANLWLKKELFTTQNFAMKEESQHRELKIKYGMLLLQLNSTRGIT